MWAIGLCLGLLVLLVSPLTASVSALRSTAASTPPPATSTNFSLQVTPSPLVATVKPGVKTQLELKIHNGGTGSENLQIAPRSFTLSNDSTKVDLHDTTPPDIASWISFSQPKFTMQAGQWLSEEVSLNVPKTAGFSYSFALVISRQSAPKAAPGQRIIQGSLAVFTLINVDRPGATSNLEVKTFLSAKRVYDYLPATFSVRFRNNGNTIGQPYGNIFIQRSANSKTPIDSLTVNETKGYILPGTERTITADWNDGFPSYHTTTDSSGKTHRQLVWDWSKLSKLRFGRYTAHLVAVYNQAGHDVPIEGNVTFWVIPWKILLIPLVILLLLLFAIYMMVRGVVRGIRRKAAKRQAKKTTAAAPEADKSDTPETPPES